MSARLYIPAAALLLTACATAQENPNYKFSSKYGTPGTDAISSPAQGPNVSSPVQVAVHGNPAPAAPVTHAPSYQYPDAVVAASSAPPLSSPMSPPVSPTEEAYDSAAMTGTPGYSVFIPEDAPSAATPAAPTPVSSAGSSSVPGSGRPVSYDYRDNMRGGTLAPAPLAAPGAMTGPLPLAPLASGYVVQPGDTVYSMSRRLCVPIADITRANGIGADYAISIGQTLSLPASRC